MKRFLNIVSAFGEVLMIVMAFFGGWFIGKWFRSWKPGQ